MCSCRGGEEEARKPERLDQHFYEEISKCIFQNWRSALLFIHGRKSEADQNKNAE